MASEKPDIDVRGVFDAGGRQVLTAQNQCIYTETGFLVGVGKMEGKKQENNEVSKTNAVWEARGVEGPLPELSRFERHWAGNPNQKSWAFKNMSAGVGHVWHMDDIGLVLQVASEDTIRLLTVVDHDYCMKMVSFVKATLESLDLNLDLSQAIKRPYTGGGESKSDGPAKGQDLHGVEVV